MAFGKHVGIHLHMGFYHCPVLKVLPVPMGGIGTQQCSSSLSTLSSAVVCFRYTFCLYTVLFTTDNPGLLGLLFVYILFYLPQIIQGYVRRRIEAKLINWPFSPLRLAS